MANHLRSNEEEIAEYLRQVLQDNDPRSWQAHWATLPAPVA